jgi:hypothetical protein
MKMNRERTASVDWSSVAPKVRNWDINYYFIV